MEERLNAVTHGTGTILAIAGLIALTVKAYQSGSIWHLLSFSVYGASLVLLFLASTLYHSAVNEKLKYIFKVFDHAAIYLLIAGTYTPFTLIVLHGNLGWTIFGAVWALACIGIVFQLFFARRFKLLSTICYLILGWFMVIAIKPLVAALPTAGLVWVIAGGILYTVGTIFYLARRIPYSHAIWHLFVLAGSASFFITVLCYVLPIRVI
ncbi:MAG TPA: hemolysin III family protein [Methylomusa anaerophila]|uniref:Haemolysin-III related n=1 Tax=Methylomusa anaerophila TaxID=1930071 RepID=A0A348AM22_9FIRM|nr:hemolysin III family protein [Methylomusa anaerophila]BBB92120.1 haemolysin-III related [Methylomusa anaerophila]HML87866.1 hemolysin III family protein [Methylomusa anaerophila]